MSDRHELKTWPAEFAAVRSGVKTFEHRKNDRNFQVNDVLVLREFDPVKFAAAFSAAMGTSALDYGQAKAIIAALDSWSDAEKAEHAADCERISAAARDAEAAAYTGEVEEREIAYVLQGGGFGVSPGYAVLGLRPPAATAAQLRDRMDPEDLAGWHFAQGQNALLRAQNARDSAKAYAAKPQTVHTAQRYLDTAHAAEEEARLHLGAAELIRNLHAATLPVSEGTEFAPYINTKPAPPPGQMEPPK